MSAWPSAMRARSAMTSAQRLFCPPPRLFSLLVSWRPNLRAVRPVRRVYLQARSSFVFVGLQPPTSRNEDRQMLHISNWLSIITGPGRALDMGLYFAKPILRNCIAYN